MKNFKEISICLLIAILISTADNFARSNTDFSQSGPSGESIAALDNSSRELILPPNRLPEDYGFQYTDQLAVSYNCFGTFGSNYFGPYNPYGNYHFPSFMTPKGGNQEYLYRGAIWVGDVIGDDTLVSVGGDGWTSYYGEFYPRDYHKVKGVTESISPTDFTMHAEFYDTLKASDNIQWLLYPYHYPLNLRIALRSHAWFDEPNSRTIIYDMVITNIGEETIKEGWVGLFFDADISDYNYKYSGYKDDLSGSIRDLGIAYSIDNDGDPVEGQYDEQNSPTRTLAVKFLETSFTPQDTNFNWWVSSGDPQLDFGPRQRGTEDDPFWEFYGQNLGTPVDDDEKYYVLSHSEWDYDQIYTATIDSSVHLWLEPDPINAADLADGADTRFLLSIGPVDINPDSSIRVSFATFTAENVHILPENAEDLPFAPDKYLANLNLSGVIENAGISDSLARTLLNPLNPVTGLRADHSDTDSIVIIWDPFVYEGVDGYEIFLSKVPFNKFPYPGVIPAWLEPECLIHYADVEEMHGYTFDNLCPDRAYFVNVASISNGATGHPGKSIIIFDSTRAPAPVIKDDYVFGLTGDRVTIEWSLPRNCHVDHFNIYKFDSVRIARTAYHAYYRHYQKDPDLPVSDSFYVNDTWYYYYAMPIYRQVDGRFRRFTDYNVDDGTTYVIAAVDRFGFESEFSHSVVFHTHTPATKEILLLTGHDWYSDYQVDTIINFYNDVLAGHNYDILDYSVDYYLYDCSNGSACACFDWRDFEPYRYLIIDATLSDHLIESTAEENNQALTRYLLSGGSIIYFGTFIKDPWINDATFHDINSDFIKRFFEIDSLFSMPYFFYYQSNFPEPYIDSLSGFIRAESVLPDAGDLDFDLSRYPFPDYLENFWHWPRGTAPGSAAFVINEKGQTTHLYRSKYPETSRAEGYPVGVKTVTDEATTYLYGFHLWYMEPDDARLLINFITGNSPTDLATDNSTTLPDRFELYQNFPNPFNAATEIKYSLPSKSHVTVAIYNILGQRINLLVDEEQTAGQYTIEWDGTDFNGRPTATGIYLYQIKAGNFIETKKMLLLK